MEKGETMKTFVYVLAAALGVVLYQLVDTQDQLQEKTEALAYVQDVNATLDKELAKQNAEIERYGELLEIKTRLAKQSAARQAEYVLRQPQITSADATELNDWLTANFGDRQNE